MSRPFWQHRVYFSGQRSIFQKEDINKEIAASKGLVPAGDRIISEVSRYYQTKPSALTGVRRGYKNESRDAALYIIRTMRAEPLKKIGAGFELNRYSSVSSVVLWVKEKMRKVFEPTWENVTYYIEQLIFMHGWGTCLFVKPNLLDSPRVCEWFAP